MEDRSVVGVEALVRWRHPTIGVIPPDLFIPMAEEGDLIEAISMIVTKTAISHQPAITMATSGSRPLYVHQYFSEESDGFRFARKNDELCIGKWGGD